MLVLYATSYSNSKGLASYVVIHVGVCCRMLEANQISRSCSRHIQFLTIVFNCFPNIALFCEMCQSH